MNVSPEGTWAINWKDAPVKKNDLEIVFHPWVMKFVHLHHRHDLHSEADTGEMQRTEHGLYAAFIELTKAFDTVSNDGLWKILAHPGCPPKFLTILHHLHEGPQGQVKHNGSL